MGWYEVPLALLAATAIAAVLAAIGARIRGRLRLPCPPSLRGPVEWCIGCWVAGVGVLACGLLGAMHAVPLLVLFGALAAVGRYDGLRDTARRLWPYLAAALLLLPIGLAPPFFYDAWVYHLGLPWQSLQEGAIRAHGENVFAAFPPLAQLVYAVPLSVDLTRVPGLLHLLASCLGAQAVAVLARRLGAPRVPAAIVGFFLLYNPVAVVVPAFPAAEGFALAATVSAAALALTTRTVGARAGLAGWMVGIALAARLQGVAWTGLIGLVVVATRRRWLRPAVLFAACALAGSLPWWLKNAVLLGDPVAPIGWKREGIDTLWRDGQSLLQQTSSVSQLLVLGWEKIVSLPWLLLPPLFLAFLAVASRRSRPALLAAGLGVAGIGVWASTGSLGRFLVPSLAVLLAVAVAARRRALAYLSAAVVAAGTVVAVVQTGGFLVRSGGLGLLGDPTAVYAKQLVANPWPAYVACAALPEDARILVVSEPRGFLLPRPFVVTSQHDTTPLRDSIRSHEDPSAVVADLRQRGFTHLLVNTGEMQRLGRDYPVLPWTDEATRARVGRFVAHLGEPVIREGPVVVYRLAER